MPIINRILAGAVVIAGLSACAGSAPTPTPVPATAPEVGTKTEVPVAVLAARADSIRRSYNRADVDFMTGMIHHHAQALEMAAMAPSHGASPQVQTLAARIINGQKGEIRLMSDWLDDRDQPVPEIAHDTMGTGMHTGHAMHGGDHHGMMPGMLTPEQMEALDAARGAEFDRLFLSFMIQHHQGALTMVEELFSSYGAAQGDAIYRIASGVEADQMAEIDRMQQMLKARLFEPVSE